MCECKLVETSQEAVDGSVCQRVTSSSNYILYSQFVHVGTLSYKWYVIAVLLVKIASIILIYVFDNTHTGIMQLVGVSK